MTALGLSLFDLPPAVPTFGPNYVEELAIANNGGVITLKLRVPSLPAQYTVVQGTSPRSPGVSCVQHFPNLGFLPAPVDGWSDTTALYVAWYGVPPVGRRSGSGPASILTAGTTSPKRPAPSSPHRSQALCSA